MLTFYGCAESEDNKNNKRRNSDFVSAILLIKGMLTFKVG
jgi:hypothetical protein